MTIPETELEMVRRHIEQAERHIREQRVRIDRLEQIGAATALAESLLELMLSLRAEHQLHLDRLLAQ